MRARRSGWFLHGLALLMVSGALVIPAPAQGSEGDSGNYKIIRLDPRFDRIVTNVARLETIVEGFTWVEVRSGITRVAIFSSPISRAMPYSSGRKARGVSRFLTASGYTGNTPFEGKEPGSNGLTFDGAERLVLCQHGDRRIVRVEHDGRRTPLADRFEGKRINSPNDLVFKATGDLYFTDPPFGLAKGFDDPQKEVPFQGGSRC